MNERIRELMAQAVTFYLDPDSNVYEAQVSPEDMELFAELIVQECLKQVRFEVQYEYDWSLADSVSERVLEHFGIEESV